MPTPANVPTPRPAPQPSGPPSVGPGPSAFPGYLRPPAASAPKAGRLGPNVTSLLALGGFGVVCEVALAVVGGAAGASVGAVMLVASAVWAGRWVVGAAAMDSGLRRRSRLVGTREPTLRYWDAAISDAAQSPDGYALHLHPLLLRLYEVRLAERHGVALRMQPDRAAAIVGPELWPWIDPRVPRTPAAVRHARSMGHVGLPDPLPLPPALLEALVARLETL
ncbi:hypothetical protein [Streptacidiphilus rugosus]|uniref:hypothetical protein n=1 Tax=Streptacidiphilus rugosus TaxID=405783 RepID=UPI0006917CEA|nr:hypothetical protein [Streptacidiphilus rugosus]